MGRDCDRAGLRAPVEQRFEGYAIKIPYTSKNQFSVSCIRLSDLFSCCYI